MTLTHHQVVAKPTHIGGALCDLMLADILDVVGIRVGAPVGTSNHSAIFIEVFLEQPIPCLVCRQEVYLKISAGWELDRGDAKVLTWNDIVRSPCPVSSLNEPLLRVIVYIVLKWTIVVRMGDKSCFDDRFVLALRAKHRAHRVSLRSRTQDDWEVYRVAHRHVQLIYEDAERAFTERVNHS